MIILVFFDKYFSVTFFVSKFKRGVLFVRKGFVFF